MATRLYLVSDNVDLVERFANVPEGTQARLDAFEANLASTGLDLESYEAYKAINADQEFNWLTSFKLFGWGRLSGFIGFDEIPGAEGDASAGAARTLEAVRAIATAIDLSEEAAQTIHASGGFVWM